MKKGDLVEALHGRLCGLWLEIVKVRPRNNIHGDLVLCETGSGRRYWLRSTNIKSVRDLTATEGTQE